MNEDARTILEIVGFFVFLAIVVVIGIASVVGLVNTMSALISASIDSIPSEVEARDAQIEECLALEKYTIEQCITIVGGK